VLHRRLACRNGWYRCIPVSSAYEQLHAEGYLRQFVERERGGKRDPGDTLTTGTGKISNARGRRGRVKSLRKDWPCSDIDADNHTDMCRTKRVAVYASAVRLLSIFNQRGGPTAIACAETNQTRQSMATMVYENCYVAATCRRC